MGDAGGYLAGILALAIASTGGGLVGINRRLRSRSHGHAIVIDINPLVLPGTPRTASCTTSEVAIRDYSSAFA